MSSGASPRAARVAIEAVALFEAAKGLAALAALLGWLELMHHDIHHLALELIGHFGLDAHSHYPALLLHYADVLNTTPVRTTVLLGSAYVSLRWVEAYGLWRERAWGEWLGALSGAIYVPFELRHLWRVPAWPGAVVLFFNIAVIAFLGARLWQRTQLKAVRQR